MPEVDFDRLFAVGGHRGAPVVKLAEVDDPEPCRWLDLAIVDRHFRGASKVPESVPMRSPFFYLIRPVISSYTLFRWRMPRTYTTSPSILKTTR